MIEAKAPGKLYIAGEYAVVEPGHPAILVAVDRFITVSLEEAIGKGSICSFNSRPIFWTRKNDQIIIEKDHGLSYIISAINIVETYAKELGRELGFFDLKISSELENDKGIKYGLGSSAAVTVATIKVLCDYYKITVSDNDIFKLASLAHLAINSNGSCGDVAASVYGGWIVFTTFDRPWVLENYKDTSVSGLISKKWPNLSIEPLKPPKELKLVIAWTGSPASTEKLVANAKDKGKRNNILYKNFLDSSKECVGKMITAFKENNIEEIQSQIQINREILLNMSNDLGFIIEIPLLSKFCEITLKYKGYGKSSGAGGGDCGIAIFKEDDDLTNLIAEYKREGIKYLPLKVYEKPADL